jgi:hypothetical protein
MFCNIVTNRHFTSCHSSEQCPLLHASFMKGVWYCLWYPQHSQQLYRFIIMQKQHISQHFFLRQEYKKIKMVVTVLTKLAF